MEIPIIDNRYLSCYEYAIDPKVPGFSNLLLAGRLRLMSLSRLSCYIFYNHICSAFAQLILNILKSSCNSLAQIKLRASTNLTILEQQVSNALSSTDPCLELAMARPEILTDESLLLNVMNPSDLKDLELIFEICSSAMFDDLDPAAQHLTRVTSIPNLVGYAERCEEPPPRLPETSSGVTHESTQTKSMLLEDQELSCSLQYHIQIVQEKLSEYTDTYNAFIYDIVPHVDTVCIICMSWIVECVFIPCGHACCCHYCLEFSSHKCPVCRSDIKDFLMLPCEGTNLEEL